MQTALQKLTAHVTTGDWRAALKLAASWPQLGTHRDAIQQGWAALRNPDFYRELGKDPEQLVAAGQAAIKERYGL